MVSQTFPPWIVRRGIPIDLAQRPAAMIQATYPDVSATEAAATQPWWEEAGLPSDSVRPKKHVCQVWHFVICWISFNLNSNLSALRTCDVLSHADSRHAASFCLFERFFCISERFYCTDGNGHRYSIGTTCFICSGESPSSTLALQRSKAMAAGASNWLFPSLLQPVG